MIAWIKAHLALLKLVGVLVLCATCFCSGGYVVHDHMTAKFNAEKLEMQRDQSDAIQKKISENDATLNAQRDLHAKEIQRYENQHKKDTTTISRNRAAVAAGGLRLPKSACSGVAASTEATDAGQGDGANTDSFELPIGIAEGLYDLEERADREVSELENRLTMCQQFARDNGFAPQ